MRYVDGDFVVLSRPAEHVGWYRSNALVTVKHRGRMIFQGGARSVESGVFRGRIAIADWKARTEHEQEIALRRGLYRHCVIL